MKMSGVEMTMIENEYCSRIECTNVVCDKNLKILAPVAIGDEIIIKDFGKECLDYVKEDFSNKDQAADLTQALKNAVDSIMRLEEISKSDLERLFKDISFDLDESSNVTIEGITLEDIKADLERKYTGFNKALNNI